MHASGNGVSIMVLPAVDLQGGRCVRLVEGDFGERKEYPHEPAELVTQYAKAGAQWIHVVDLDGARDGAQRHRALIAEMCRASTARLQVGGGLREPASVEALLEGGAGRVVIGSRAVLEPDATLEWLDRFGPERVVIALDVRLDDDGNARVHTHGWTRADAADPWPLLERYAHAGLEHLLCTDIGRDGRLSGPNVALYRRLAERFPTLSIQASGGISGMADLERLSGTGVTAAITGKALLEGKITLRELSSCWRDASSPV